MRHSGHSIAHSSDVKKGHYLHDLYLFTPLLVLLSVTPAAVFYSYNNGWDTSTSIFYSVQVIMGELYGVPGESQDDSKMFTLGLFLWGNLITFGAIGSLSSRLVYDTIKEERRRVRFDYVKDFNSDGLINYKDYIIYYFNNFLYEIGWELHKPKYITITLCLIWIAFGCSYGLFIEEMSLYDSLYFSVGMISCSGLPAPLCTGPSDSKCAIPTQLALFMTFFIVIGVPLFTFTLGQFSGLIIQKAVHFTEVRVLTRPLKEIEFQSAIALCKRKDAAIYAYNTKTYTNTDNNTATATAKVVEADAGAIGEHNEQFSSSHSSHGYINGNVHGYGSITSSSNLPAPILNPNPNDRITLAEFLTLELIRLKRVDEDDIEEICDLFHELDSVGKGYLDIDELVDSPRLSRRNSINNTINNTINNYNSNISNSDFNVGENDNIEFALLGRSPTIKTSDSSSSGSKHDNKRLNQQAEFEEGAEPLLSSHQHHLNLNHLTKQPNQNTDRSRARSLSKSNSSNHYHFSSSNSNYNSNHNNMHSNNQNNNQNNNNSSGSSSRGGVSIGSFNKLVMDRRLSIAKRKEAEGYHKQRRNSMASVVVAKMGHHPLSPLHAHPPPLPASNDDIDNNGSNFGNIDNVSSNDINNNKNSGTEGALQRWSRVAYNSLIAEKRGIQSTSLHERGETKEMKDNNNNITIIGNKDKEGKEDIVIEDGPI